MSETGEERFEGRIWPPIYRRGHRVESAEDLVVLECAYELLADCKLCPPENGRHKTHLDALDFKTLREAYGAHWFIGFYIDKGWNVVHGICQACLDDQPNRRPSKILLPTHPETRRLVQQVGHRRN